MENKTLIKKITDILPQMQCKKCEYQDCKSYASSIIEKQEKTNKCDPGGQETENQIEKILSKEIYEPTKQSRKHLIADIVREECIGCTICIRVCPVDAIVGAKHMIHRVLENQCNGCELCIDECPVDCMSMVDNVNKKIWSWPSVQSELSKEQYYNKIERIARIKKEKEVNRQKVLEERDMEDYIEYALDFQAKKFERIKKYE
tara:strand:- start:1041 stop:1649 length:609 start_codon:yes stop_codon:yes gene_type:complete